MLEMLYCNLFVDRDYSKASPRLSLVVDR